MTATAPKLPRELMAGGSSVAVIGMPLGPGSLAHKPRRATRPHPNPRYRTLKVVERFTTAACAPKKDADEAAEFSVAWADHLGAIACTEPACFPNAR